MAKGERENRFRWDTTTTGNLHLRDGTRATHNVLIQGSVVVIRQFLIFINQTVMVSVALVTMVD